MRQGVRALAVGVLAGLVTLGCDTVKSWTSPREAPAIGGAAQLSVKLWSGFSQRPEAPQARLDRVEIVLDSSTSMQAAAPGSPARFVAAHAAAERLLRKLPASTGVGLRVLGADDGDCTEAHILARSAADASPDEVARLLGPLRPRSEGSLAATLGALRDDLGEGAARTRVVLFSDLGAECGGDVCAAASSLVDAGARLDVVLLSGAVVPKCFARFTPSGEARAERLARPPPAPAFRVDTHIARTGETGQVLARGRADGQPIAMASGPVTIALLMEPASMIGPLVLSPGTLTRVRVLDFPTLDPPVREWRWDIIPLGGDDPAAGDGDEGVAEGAGREGAGAAY